MAKVSERKAWSETNITAELRNFRFTNGAVHGEVYDDKSLTYADGFTIILSSFRMEDYRDHYIIKTGNSRHGGKYYVLYKKFERKT